MQKNAKVIMLPTNEKASIHFHVLDNMLFLQPNNTNANSEICKNQHLYFLSDEEIKKGDWIGYPNLKTWTPIQYLGGDLTGNEKKIIATTNKSLGLNSVKVPVSSDFTLEQISQNMPCLPQIPQSFIEHYVAEYNKGNLITDVEY